jgi:hypothetical protein
LDTAPYSDAYVMGWADGDMNLVKQCAQTVLRAAKEILTDLTPHHWNADPDADPDTDGMDTDEPAGPCTPTAASTSTTRRRCSSPPGCLSPTDSPKPSR